MTDRTCKNCIFWLSMDNAKFGFCENNKFMNLYPHSNSLQDDILVYIGEYEPGAILETGQNFGCIHFEKKS